MAKMPTRLLRPLHALTLGLATMGAAAGLLAGCAPTPAPGSRDVGSMAFPNPAPQGQIGQTNPLRNSDVGSMAYPAPVPQGQVGTSAVRRGY